MVVTESISLSSRGNGDIIDITPQVEQQLAKSGVSSGILTLFVAGSTAGVTTIEFEPGLIADFKELWQRLAPQNITYAHDRAWGDGNGHSHVRASLLGASLVIPVSNKRLVLGTWQQVVLVDFDNRPRSRRVMVQVMGE
ncbi:MAG: secondary thiamine-phosphate synthase enzyme YjbQ [Dehalococcoidales bacterium]|nr:secondary thiamine-phosphate synthase enzyme YjbQ [Dehalococcoidales bacterium]